MNDTLRGMLESLAIIGITLTGCAVWLAAVITLAGGAK